MFINKMIIPKIIHNICLHKEVNKNECLKIQTFIKNNYPGYDYILWTEEEIKNRGIKFLSKKTETISNPDIKQIIILLEILFKYGGIYIDHEIFFDVKNIKKLAENENLLENNGFFMNEKGSLSDQIFGLDKKSDIIKMFLTTKKYAKMNYKTKEELWKTLLDLINNNSIAENIKIYEENYFFDNLVKYVVLYCKKERKKYMKEQFAKLNFNKPVEFFKGFTPENSVDYIQQKYEKVPEKDTEISCFRSHIAILDKYKDSHYKYINIMEDDISILSNIDLHNKIVQVIEKWKKYDNIDCVTLGYNLCAPGSIFDTLKKDDDFYYNANDYNGFWGLQMTLYKLKTAKYLASNFHVSNTTEIFKNIENMKEKYHIKVSRIQIDSLLMNYCNFGVIYPPLCIENPTFESSINRGLQNHQNKFFMNHPKIDFLNYYQVNQNVIDSIITDFNIPNKEGFCKNKRTIAISFGSPNTPMDLYSNGIRQNVLNFYEVLYYIGHEVYLVVDKPIPNDFVNIFKRKYRTVVFGSSEYESINFEIFFQMGLSISYDAIKKLKEKKCKFVGYKCGNDYIFDMEQVLFSSRDTDWPQHCDFSFNKVFDEVWSIPQMANTNQYYWKTRYRCETKVIPFIWSPAFLDAIIFIDNLNNGGKYYNQGPSKRIGIFEPNLNVFKYALPALYVCENAYRELENKDLIERVFITNILNKQNKKEDKKEDKKEEEKKEDNKKNYGNFNELQFSRMTYSLDLYKDSKLSVEGRYVILYFMSRYAHIAISHQWENPLNYLYLDLAWLGWPIIHNAHLCKDIGYYYEGFNYEEGGKVLKDVIENHDKNIDAYICKNRELLKRYLPTNKELLKEYDRLIDNLFINDVEEVENNVEEVENNVEEVKEVGLVKIIEETKNEEILTNIEKTDVLIEII